jgi:hypothetical protein
MERKYTWEEVKEYAREQVEAETRELRKKLDACAASNMTYLSYFREAEADGKIEKLIIKECTCEKEA